MAASRVEFGGLARTDQAGYGEEFARLVRDLAGPAPDPAAGSAPGAETAPATGPAPAPATGTERDGTSRADGEDHHGR